MNTSYIDTNRNIYLYTLQKFISLELLGKPRIIIRKYYKLIHLSQKNTDVILSGNMHTKKHRSFKVTPSTLKFRKEYSIH